MWQNQCSASHSCIHIGWAIDMLRITSLSWLSHPFAITSVQSTAQPKLCRLNVELISLPATSFADRPAAYLFHQHKFRHLAWAIHVTLWLCCLLCLVDQGEASLLVLMPAGYAILCSHFVKACQSSLEAPNDTGPFLLPQCRRWQASKQTHARISLQADVLDFQEWCALWYELQALDIDDECHEWRLLDMRQCNCVRAVVSTVVIGQKTQLGPAKLANMKHCHDLLAH